MTGPQPPYYGPGGSREGEPQSGSGQQWGQPQWQPDQPSQPGQQQWQPGPQWDQGSQWGQQPQQQWQQPNQQWQPGPQWDQQQGYPPQGAYPQFGPPPGPPSKSKLPWILGGVGAVVLVVIALIVALVVFSGSDSGDDTKYSIDKVNNGCDLVDVAALKKWAPTQTEAPTHTENKSEYLSSVDCNARYEGKGKVTSHADLSMRVQLAGKSDQASSFYDIIEKSGKSTTGSGYKSGDLGGFGSKAFYSSSETQSKYSSSVSYEVGVLDDNAVVSVRISAFGDAGDVEYADVKKVVDEQTRKALDKLQS